MIEASKTKPLNMAESWSTVDEFTNFCHKEKERRMNSDEGFDDTAFEEAQNLALAKLIILKQDGWV
ncbi:MAG: hypothetical protein KZQ83_02775 [gamma proteobacterium symbiont of Taylorina sp.]|nr:hypothetical protein [gamma proteobacterium symbiont of Taylorina sp.]